MTKRKDPSERLKTLKLPKPQFKAKQEVWYMRDNKPVTGKIQSISITAYGDDNPDIRYRLGDDPNSCLYNRTVDLPPKYIFATKEKLLESLMK